MREKRDPMLMPKKSTPRTGGAISLDVRLDRVDESKVGRFPTQKFSPNRANMGPAPARK